MRTIAILGVPGVGKTWAIYKYMELLAEVYSFDQIPEPKKIGLVEYHIIGNVAFVGKYDGSKFQGTDRLSMAVSPHFVQFFAEMVKQGIDTVVAEGDRINCMGFLKTATYHGPLIRVKCVADPVTLKQRRDQRNHVFPQAFLKTVATKVDKHTFDHEFDSDGVLAYLKTL